MAEDEQVKLYSWVDEIPLSRPKKNISRDFSDGVLMAEVLKHFFPKLVEIHNYTPANAIGQKIYNWNTLNRNFYCIVVTGAEKVFRKLNIRVSNEDIEAVVTATPGKVEEILQKVKQKVEENRQLKLQKQQEQLAAKKVQPFSLQVNTIDPKSTPNSRLNTIDLDVKALLEKKDQTIAELQEHIENLEARIMKLEQVVRIKESKINKLSAKLQKAGLSP